MNDFSALNIPTKLTLSSDDYAKLTSMVGWYNAMPVEAEEVVGDGFHEDVYDYVQAFELNGYNAAESEGFYLTQFDVINDQLYALFQDDENQWEDPIKVKVTVAE